MKQAKCPGSSPREAGGEAKCDAGSRNLGPYRAGPMWDVYGISYTFMFSLSQFVENKIGSINHEVPTGPGGQQRW